MRATTLLLLLSACTGKGDPSPADDSASTADERRAVLDRRLDDSLGQFDRTLGEEHPGTLTSINNMGFLLRDQGKFAEALPLLRAAQQVKPRENIQSYLDQVERVAKQRGAAAGAGS